MQHYFDCYTIYEYRMVLISTISFNHCASKMPLIKITAIQLLFLHKIVHCNCMYTDFCDALFPISCRHKFSVTAFFLPFRE